MTKLRIIVFTLMIVLVIGVIYSLSQLPTSAQGDGPPIPLPDSPSMDNPITLYADPATYHIVYLTLNENDHSALASLLKTEPVRSQETLSALDWQRPVEAVIVDQSAYQILDPEWMGDAYRRGVVLASINLGYVEQAELLNSACARERAKDRRDEIEMLRSMVPNAESVYVIRSQLIQADNPEFAPTAVYRGVENCRKHQEVEGAVYTSGRGSLGFLFSTAKEQTSIEFVNDIMFHIDDMRDARHNFQNRHLSPTPGPRER